MGLFEVLASEDHEGRIATRKATAIAKKRVDERFAGFIAQANDSNERKNRIDLVRDDLVDLVTATCREYGVEPDTITKTILAHLAAEPKDECKCGGNCKCNKESRTASVHEARRPKVCPYHREVMDISLAQGEPRAGFDAMAQHAWGPQHCKGNEYEGGNCNFKPEMTTQTFWDERAEKAQERREEREKTLQEQQQQEAEAVQEPSEDEHPAATLEDGFEGEQVETTPDNVVDVDFGATDGTSAVGEGVETPEMAMAAALKKEALTAKDFVLIADAIAKSPVEDKQALAVHFAGYLSHTNPNFDQERFIAAAIGQPTSGRDTFRGPGGPAPQVPLASRTAAWPPLSESSPRHEPEPPGAALCPQCGGTGGATRADNTCVRCGGTGTESSGIGCGQCGGTGESTSSSFCTYCGGTGNLTGDQSPHQSRTAEQKQHLKGVDSDKRQRQYEHIKEQCLKDGKGEDECKELAARTVNKQRAEKGETKGSKVAEALETVDVTKGGEDPIPKIDKRKWTPENVKKRLDTEGEGSPHPTREKDILDRIDYHDEDPFAETDAVLEKQDVEKDTSPKPGKQTWASREDDFLSDEEIQAALARNR